MRFALIISLMLLFTTGCGGDDGPAQVPVFPVTGKITNAGAPLADAAVTFSPEGKQPVATGRTDAQGVYNLTTYDFEDGAAAGDYTVMVTKIVEKAAEATTLGHDASGGGSTAPSESHSGQGAKTTKSVSMANPRYSSAGSPLKATVKEDDNSFDFALEP